MGNYPKIIPFTPSYLEHWLESDRSGDSLLDVVQDYQSYPASPVFRLRL